MSTELITILISIVLIGGGIILFKITFKRIFTELFSRLSKKHLAILLITVIGLIFSFSDFLTPFFFEENENTKIQFIKENYEAEKTDTEVVVEAVNSGVKIVDELITQKRKRDSIKRLNKDKYWVYQIGTSKRSKDDIWGVYNSLKSIPNIKVFKESRKSYYIIKDDGLTKDELLKAKKTFVSKIGFIENRVKIIDLSTFCSIRKDIKTTKRLTKRKLGLAIPCLICSR